ncbi:MAG: UDP-glucose/GDP-mannose dehydrogenase family protein [Proteobacteria bacterium]|nr:UDP-glucose/GDP-mannose dehydrogenase family protein [Pseudomonadota bacterium]
MQVTIVGSGYVGLVSGACLADVGNHVLCMDVDPDKIDNLKSGKIPIYEPGLEELITTNSSEGRLNFTTDLDEAVAFGEAIFIAVGTPPDEDGAADLQHVLAVARGIGDTLAEYRVIINKSTVPVGTAAKVRSEIQSRLDVRGVQVEFSVVSNPEFLKEGAAIEDFLKPDRIVIGTDDDQPRELMRELYAPFNRSHDRLLFMDLLSAELTKYAANAMLATKISFMNELANIAERVGADIETVRVGIGSDPRIGYHFIYPGCGYGGSCFPKDVQALARTAETTGYEPKLLNAVEAVNHAQKLSLVEKVISRFGEDLTGYHFAVWGLAFKPNTDDMRDAPSSVMIRELCGHGATICAFDPVAIDEARDLLADVQGVTFGSDPYNVIEGADALLLVTEWKAFRSPDLSRIHDGLRTPVVFDGRNVFDPEMVRKQGLDYYSIGRRPMLMD